MLHHFAYILRLLECGYQQRVFGLDNHEIADADQRDKFARSVNIIVLCIQAKLPDAETGLPSAGFVFATRCS